jgi:hypothetical protein
MGQNESIAVQARIRQVIGQSISIHEAIRADFTSPNHAPNLIVIAGFKTTASSQPDGGSSE